jgi:hypothetical protein
MEENMTRGKARAIYNELFRFRRYEASVYLQKAILQLLRAGRINIDLSIPEARLRLERPLQNGTAVLKARSLSVAERAATRLDKGIDKKHMPLEAMKKSISVMNGIGIESLEGLSEGDQLVLVWLGAFLAE